MSPLHVQFSLIEHTATLPPMPFKFEGDESIELYTRSLFRTNFAIDKKTWTKLKRVAHSKTGVFDVRLLPGQSNMFAVEFVPELCDTEVHDRTNRLLREFIKAVVGVPEVTFSAR